MDLEGLQAEEFTPPCNGEAVTTLDQVKNRRYGQLGEREGLLERN
jgi:hypothetical protein